MKALQFKVSIPKYLLQRTLSSRFRNLLTSSLSLVSLREIPIPVPINEHWVRIRTLRGGICGTDLSILRAKASFYLEPYSSEEFIPGHEIVGEIVEKSPTVKRFKEGDLVAVDPLLTCLQRGIRNRCMNCRRGDPQLCLNYINGPLGTSTAIGFSKETGGGWGEYFVAHQSQLYRIPDRMSLEDAILLEPLSVAIHAVLRRYPPNRGLALVLGSGTIGLLTIAALRMLNIKCRIIATGRYQFQREMASQLGAHVVVDPQKEDLYEVIAKETKARILKPSLGKRVVDGGVDCVYDTIASVDTIDDALRLTQPGGTVILIGSAGKVKGVDLTPVWFREVNLIGSVWLGVELFRGKRRKTFEMAIDAVKRNKRLPLKELVTHQFALNDWKKAIQTAQSRSSTKSIKVVFRFD